MNTPCALLIITALLLVCAFAWRANRHRQRLANQVSILEALVDGTPHPIYIRDHEGRLLSCNDSYLRTFGCERDSIIGRTASAGVLHGSSDAVEYEQLYREVIASGTAVIQDRSLALAGRTLTIYHWTLPYRGANGVVSGVVCGWVDISERRHLLDELRQAKELADQANAAKSTFLATLSHEIRTPMNAVLGLLEIALQQARQGLPDEPALATAHRAGQGLQQLIGDVLDISRIEAGQLQVVNERVDLAALVQDTAAMFTPSAQDKHLALRVETEPAACRSVRVDPLRLRQILSNLVSNAIKYTQKGEVVVSLQHCAGAPPGSLAVRLAVSDTGVGMVQADQARAFAPYTQFATGAGGRPGAGAGLGLAICRELCELLGAELHLHSTPGQGTCVSVSVTLPLEQPLAQHPAGPAPHPLGAARVLVVDDHPANRLVLARQLKSLGLVAHCCEDGAQALAQWVSHGAELVIADCNMPTLDGYGLAREIRAIERQQARTRCVILGYTANAQAEEQARCRAAGMDGCLFKPLQLTALHKALEHHLGTVASTPLPAALRSDQALCAAVAQSCRADRDHLALATGVEQRLALAHRIKGMARIIGAAALNASAEGLEAACQAGAGEDAACQALSLALQALETTCCEHHASLAGEPAN